MAAARKAPARKPAKTASASANDAFASAENISSAAQDQFERISTVFAENAEAMRGQAEELLGSVQGNLESTRTRFEAVNADLMDAARQEASDAVDFVQNLARAKSVADALEIQQDYWTNLFDSRVERTRSLTKASVEAARDSFEPFSKSLSAFSANAAFEKFLPFGAK